MQQLGRIVRSFPFWIALGVFISFLTSHHQMATVYHYCHRGDYRPAVMTLRTCYLEVHRGGGGGVRGHSHTYRRSRVTGSIDGQDCVGDGYLLEVKARTTEELMKEVPSRELAVLYAPRLGEGVFAQLDMSLISASFAKRGLTYIAWLVGLSNSVLVGVLCWVLCAVLFDSYQSWRLRLERGKIISLTGSQISDKRLAKLANVKKLTMLFLSNCPITDAHLRHIARLTELEHLDLSGTQVTDEGLVHLQGLTRLKDLYVCKTSVTRTGKKALRAALPQCKIHKR
jgi:hypothetical protein